MAKKFIIIQHVPHEILGTFHPLLKENDIRIKYVNFHRETNTNIKFKGYDGLVILGGPMSAYDHKNYPFLIHEQRMIEEALKENIKIIGICLGAQLIAQVLGARVYKNELPEIGWYDVELTETGKKDHFFKFFKDKEKIFQWHSDSFDLPKGAKHLASSQLCKNQGFCYDDNVYALQFHLEVDKMLIERWLKVKSYQEELNTLEEKKLISKEIIKNETKAYIENLKNLSNNTFNHYLKKI